MKTANITIVEMIKNLKAATNKEIYVEALVDAVAELAITLLETTQAAKMRVLEQIFEDYSRYGTIESEYTVDMNKMAKDKFGKDSAEQLVKATVLKSFKGLWFGNFEESEKRVKWVQYRILSKKLMDKSIRNSGVKEPAIKGIWDSFCHAFYLVENLKKDESQDIQFWSESLLVKMVDAYTKKLSKFSEAEIRLAFNVDELEEKNGIKLVPVYEKADQLSISEFIASLSFKVFAIC